MTTHERLGDLTVANFIDQLASAAPVPGGGSAAAVGGSLAAGLVAMVASLSEGREAYAQHAALLARSIDAGRTMARRLLDLADEDATTYARFVEALKLPRETDAQRESRTAAIHTAARGAADVPLRVIEACVEVAALAEDLAGRSNRNAASDIEVAALLAAAAAESAAANVRINLPSMGDEAAARELSERTEQLLGEVRDLAERTRAVVASGERRAPL